MATRIKTKEEKEWVSIERPSYLGRHKDERYAEWDAKYGKGNWRLVWKVDGRTLDFLGLCEIYEEAYYQFLKNNPSILKRLVSEASDVYDDAPSNVNSKFDYTKQETERTHVQDIAIRRVVLRLGETFRGIEPIQIRHTQSKHPLGLILSPGKVPLHNVSLIEQPALTGWWDENTVEALYQSNKFLQIKKEF